MKENKLLYFLEGLACIFVILIHCDMSGIVGDLLEVIGRFAVPLFFMVSGYFNRNSDNKKIVKRIKKIIIIFIVSIVVYWVYLNIKDCIIDSSYNFLSYNLNLLSYTNILRMFLFNYTAFISSPLWFLIALLYCYIYNLILNKSKKSVPIFCYVFIFFMGYILNIFLLNKYDVTYNYLIRNWIFIGIPFYMLGKNIENIPLYKLNYNKIKFLIIFGLILSIIEKISIKIMFNGKMDVYIGTFLFTITLFIMALKKPDIAINDYIVKVGKEYSLNIYIIHYIFVSILKNIMPYYNIRINDFVIAIITICLSISLAILINKLKNFVNTKKLII